MELFLFFERIVVIPSGLYCISWNSVACSISFVRLVVWLCCVKTNKEYGWRAQQVLISPTHGNSGWTSLPWTVWTRCLDFESLSGGSRWGGKLLRSLGLETIFLYLEMVILWVQNFKNDFWGVIMEKADSLTSSQISWINSGGQWCDQCSQSGLPHIKLWNLSMCIYVTLSIPNLEIWNPSKSETLGPWWTIWNKCVINGAISWRLGRH